MCAHNKKELRKWAAIACCSARPVDWYLYSFESIVTVLGNVSGERESREKSTENE